MQNKPAQPAVEASLFPVGDQKGPSSLPVTCSTAEMNARNRKYWDQQVNAHPPEGEAAVRPKVG